MSAEDCSHAGCMLLLLLLPVRLLLLLLLPVRLLFLVT
jgi:hypothetical protein